MSSRRNIIIECHFYLPTDDVTSGCGARPGSPDWIAPRRASERAWRARRLPGKLTS